MRLTRLAKVNIGWASIIVIGIGTFVWARGSVSQNRYAIMKTRERIREQALQEHEMEKKQKSQQSSV